ncbi:DUF2330 domain-containing protein [Myxococcota bacterium]
MRQLWSTALSLALVLASPWALASVGLLVGQDGAKRVLRTTQVVLLIRDHLTVVTVAADFVGPLGPMVWLLPVPGDVTRERVRAAKREFLGRLEQITAPRYHEFFEMDPCLPGKPQQTWQYAPRVPSPGLQVGSRLLPRDDGPVPREMGIALSAVFHAGDGPYAFHVLRRPSINDVLAWLGRRGFRMPSAWEGRLSASLAGRKNLVMAEVDPKKLGLFAEGAELGPVRYWSEIGQPVVPATAGLPQVAPNHDLYVYVLAGQRHAPTNYRTVVMPTNVKVARGANEKLSALHDALDRALRIRSPKCAMFEYSWSTDGCGEPCPNARLLPHELLSLGGDVIEERLASPEERAPDPMVETVEEQRAWRQKLASLRPAERVRARREHAADRRELARRLALIGRQRYVLTRLRWRYGPLGLDQDPALAPVAGILGGRGVPKGQAAELSGAVKAARLPEYQVRYVHMTPWAYPIRCANPQRWRWGKRPSVGDRSWHKVWVATGLGRSRMDEAEARSLVATPLPELQWVPAGPPAAGGQGATRATGRGCGCEVVEPELPAVWLWQLALCGLILRPAARFRPNPRSCRCVKRVAVRRRAE